MKKLIIILFLASVCFADTYTTHQKPNVDSALDLGTATLYWRYIYGDAFTDGTFTVTGGIVTGATWEGVPIDISDFTNLVAGINITLADDTLNVDDAFLINDGDDTTTGTITAAGLIIIGNSVFGLNSSVFQPAAGGDSTTFFQILDADGGTPIFNIDSTNEKVGIGTASPNAPLEVKGLLPERVGGFWSGLLHVTNADNAQFANSVITGHNSYSTNTQLWYLGSVAGGNDDIAFINRQDAALSLWTNNIRRLTITKDGYIGVNVTDPETLTEWMSTEPYLTLHNSTEEDTDGGRESRINFKGEQSGGEETTLARIEISHDGDADDEKGKIVFSTNDGSDSDTPTDHIKLDAAGITYIGDAGTTDYTQFSAIGAQTMHGDARVGRHIVIGGASWKLGATAPTVTYENIFPTISFNTGQNDEAHYTTIVPHWWDDTTDMEVEVHWQTPNSGDTGKVLWKLKYIGVKEGEDPAGAGTEISQLSAGNHPQDELIETYFTTKMLAANLEREDSLGLMLWRNGTDGSDDLGEDAELVALHIHYTMNQLGESLLLPLTDVLLLDDGASKLYLDDGASFLLIRI